jgi:hypothetical protein
MMATIAATVIACSRTSVSRRVRARENRQHQPRHEEGRRRGEAGPRRAVAGSAAAPCERHDHRRDEDGRREPLELFARVVEEEAPVAEERVETRLLQVDFFTLELLEEIGKPRDVGDGDSERQERRPGELLRPRGVEREQAAELQRHKQQAEVVQVGRDDRAREVSGLRPHRRGFPRLEARRDPKPEVAGEDREEQQERVGPRLLAVVEGLVGEGDEHGGDEALPLRVELLSQKEHGCDRQYACNGRRKPQRLFRVAHEALDVVEEDRVRRRVGGRADTLLDHVGERRMVALLPADELVVPQRLRVEAVDAQGGACEDDERQQHEDGIAAAWRAVDLWLASHVQSRPRASSMR